MWNSRPVVIVVAPTGAEVTRAQQPALPHTPREIADSALECVDAGASLVHIHVREPDGTPSANPLYFQETVDRVREGSDLITMVSTGGSVEMSIEERLTGLDAVPDLAGIETGSLNFGDDLFITSRADSFKVGALAAEAGVPLEAEVFDVGHVHSAVAMMESGQIAGPPRFNLVLGVPGGIGATPEALDAMVRALPRDANWTVTAIGRHQRRMLALGLLLGATGIRVGFEDNVYLRKGVLASSNAELVVAAADLARSLGREVATTEQAREILQLPRLARVGS
ncbi:3-keto-5-aminohexanoate cleavage protein [Streptomyces sp. NPDC056390]|uniref:3-keto-5-aminohexanoate cleavage protein n=1 Tax=Streptomyces sp. NPDC056390 TaxID=3345806 RepID=UPI0035D94D5A